MSAALEQKYFSTSGLQLNQLTISVKADLQFVGVKHVVHVAIAPPCKRNNTGFNIIQIPDLAALDISGFRQL